MYLRIKRKKQTYFLACDTKDKVISLKEKLSKLIDKEKDCIKLIYGKEDLNDDFPLETCKLKNDDVLFLVFKIDGKWEEVDVTKPTDGMEEE
eukprot:gene6980-11146_t